MSIRTGLYTLAGTSSVPVELLGGAQRVQIAKESGSATGTVVVGVVSAGATAARPLDAPNAIDVASGVPYVISDCLLSDLVLTPSGLTGDLVLAVSWC